MQALRRSVFVRYIVVPVTALALFSGCYKWTAGGLGQVTPENPRTVRVTTSEPSVHVLKDAVVFGDSLVGFVESEERMAMHLSNVRRIEVQRFDGVGTMAMVGGVVLVVAAIGFAVMCAEDEQDFIC